MECGIAPQHIDDLPVEEVIRFAKYKLEREKIMLKALYRV